MKNSIFFILLFFGSFVSGQNVQSFDFQTGDIIFQSSQSGQSRAVQLATNSKYSHVGLIYIENKHTYVLEAVQPVKKTPIEEWIKHGDNHEFSVKRLKNKTLFADKKNQEKIYSECGQYMGKNYDIYFNWSDKELYCSELVWKVYKQAFGIELCPLRKLKSFNLEHAEVKRIMKVRYGDNVPFEEKVVAPSDIYDSKLLITVKK